MNRNEPWAKKSLGQHWLHDMSVLEEMTEAVQPNDTVLEIGPGTGSLTEVLLTKGAKVVAVEKDETLLNDLRKKFAREDFSLVNQSILEFDLTKLPGNYKVVANIPYYLTSNLIRNLSEASNQPALTTLLVQKEVAQRVDAKAGDMSLLSVSAQFYWEVSLGSVVPARLFTPPPKVDSQIVKLTRRKKPLYSVDTRKFFQIVKAGFGERRKTLSNSLTGGMRIDKAEVVELLVKAGINPGQRAQALSLDDWYRMYAAFNT